MAFSYCVFDSAQFPWRRMIAAIKRKTTASLGKSSCVVRSSASARS
jgi:hypothetical protein